jgi:membrane-bound lytic murein transglycosylase D
MHGIARVSNCRIATWLALAVLLLGVACAPSRREATTVPQHVRSGDPAAPDVEDVADEWAGAADAADAEGDARTEARTRARADAEGAEGGEDEESAAAEPDPIEGPFPDEELSRAPHDVLDQVGPDADRPLELAPLPPSMPSYDIPMAYNDQVQFWIDFYTIRNREVFEAGLARSGRYMGLFREIFAEAGLPLDLIHLAHVESGYKTSAYSRSHARGVFQFISGTGRRYGLRIDYWVDERVDPEKSARAAVAYLSDLHAEFGDWYLALAAYNAGEGRIRSALRKSGRDDFWGIARTSYIRRETKNYVPAILATVMIAKDPSRYGIDTEPEPRVLYDSVEVEGAADLEVLARCAGTDLETMKQLNPALRRHQTPPDGATSVRVPIGSAERTLAALARVPVGERVLYARHRVSGGDTLYAIARRYDVSVAAIQQTNHMGRRTTIHVGDVLVIPTAAAASRTAQAGTTVASASSQAADTPSATSHRASSSKAVVHTVRRGETLYRIAALYDTTVELLCALNHISAKSTLYPGTRLSVR